VKTPILNRGFNADVPVQVNGTAIKNEKYTRLQVRSFGNAKNESIQYATRKNNAAY
jgi:hypothetical protein